MSFHNYTAKELVKLMWTLADKPERFATLRLIADNVPMEPEVLKEQFWSVWVSHESIYLDHDHIDHLLGMLPQGTYIPAGEDEDAGKDEAVFAALPEVVTIYRGSNSEHPHGFSWTLDQPRAKWFAQRSSGYGDPAIYAGVVDKAKIIGYTNDRSEAEIVVRPEDVRDIEVMKLRSLSKKLHNHNNFYRAIHEGLLDNSDMDRARAEMNLSSVAKNPERLQSYRESFVKYLEPARLLGLNRTSFLETTLQVIDEYLAKGNPTVDALSRGGHFAL